jgi:hypothetical protein
MNRTQMDTTQAETRITHLAGPLDLQGGRDDAVLICVVQDGALYIPSFLEHYRSLGIRHFVFLDNHSSDGTVSLLSTAPDVTLFFTDLPYKNNQLMFQSVLMERFARNRWCLCVDIDEYFDYPYSSMVPFGELLRYLSANEMTAVACQMLDMFPERIERNGAQSFERSEHVYYDLSGIEKSPYWKCNNHVPNKSIRTHSGGIRGSVFGAREICLTKHPLLFFDSRVQRLPGGHWVDRARVADLTGVLFHYKFTSQFYELTEQAVKTGKYFKDSSEYRKYHEVLKKQPTLTIRQASSKRFQRVNRLLEEEFLVVSRQFMKWAQMPLHRRENEVTV